MIVTLKQMFRPYSPEAKERLEKLEAGQARFCAFCLTSDSRKGWVTLSLSDEHWHDFCDWLHAAGYAMQVAEEAADDELDTWDLVEAWQFVKRYP